MVLRGVFKMMLAQPIKMRYASQSESLKIVILKTSLSRSAAQMAQIERQY